MILTNFDKYDFLPTNADEMKALGWEQADVILISGDAYVDHPSFGTAIIARTLEAKGYKVGIIPQPNWRDDLRDFKKMGKPRLFFGVSSGNMDSMVNHYTARKRLRSDDAYTAGNKSGFRPDYATSVYSQILKKIFPDTPIVLGGIEASMRRFTHYDYWSDKLLPSILISSAADILVYGMGELPIIEIANKLNDNKKIEALTDIPQTVYLTKLKPASGFILPAHEKCITDKKLFAKHFIALESNAGKYNSPRLIEPYNDYYIIANPPCKPLNDKESDKIYELPFTRLPHPRYRKKPPIPAYEMIKHSVNIHRGCFAACAFCTISMHQGRTIQSRSEKSILNELEKVKSMPDFHGVISDLGGPSANMYGMQIKDDSKCVICKRHSCLYPAPCKNIDASHKKVTNLYKKAANINGINHIFIGSGIRYDLFLNDNGYINDGEEYFDLLVKKHVSGRLKVAPESCDEKVLRIMRKPSYSLFRKLKKEYEKLNYQNNKNQQIIPYLITGHPGSTLESCIENAKKLKADGIYPEQIQDFTPTPMTLSSTIFYLGFNPYDNEKLEITKNIDDKKLQNQIYLWHKKEVKILILNKLRQSNLYPKLKTLLEYK